MLFALVAALGTQPPRSVADSMLYANAIVRVRVPTMKGAWYRGRLVRSTSAIGCLAVMIEMESPDQPQRFVFLHGVDSLAVDRRTNTGIMALNLPPAADADWQVFTRQELVAANAGCKGERRLPKRRAPTT